MGFLHIGQNVMVNDRRIIDDIPKSFLGCDHPYHRQIVYISQLNTQTLVKRAEKK
mgnify:CR=1 FL=1